MAIANRPVLQAEQFGGMLSNIDLARNLFDTYVTGVTPSQDALNFWANAIATQGLQGATQSFLNPSDPNAPRLATMRNDPDYLAAVGRQAPATTASAPATGGGYSVTDMYYQYLGRAPTAEELTKWQGITSGGASKGIDPDEITNFLTQSVQAGENPAYFAPVTSRPLPSRSEEGMLNVAPSYQPTAREGDREFEGQKYFESDRVNIFNQLKAQQEAGIKYTASFTQDETEILNDLSKRLAAQGVTNLADLKPIMSGETVSDSGEGQMVRGESVQIGLYNSKTGEPLNTKMLTNNQGKGTTNYQAVFVNGLPVFTASKAATGLQQIQQDFGPILAIAASAILPGIPVGNQTLGQFLGTSLGLEGAAAQAVGNALAAGGGTFAATGSAEKAALAALLVGGGGFIKDTGVLGDVMDQVGLGDFKQTFGVLNSAQVGDAAFVAADASQLASQGLGVEGIQQNLIMAGVDSTVAASAANLAASGATATQIAQDIANFTGGNNIFTGVDTGAGTGITTTTGAGQTGLGEAAGTTAGGGTSFADAVAQAQADRFGTAGQAGFSGIDQSTALAGGTTTGTFGNVGTGGFGTALGSATDLANALTGAGLSAGTAANLAGLTAAGTGATGLLGGATALGTGAAAGLGAAAGAGAGAATGAGAGAAGAGTGAGLGAGAGSLLGNLAGGLISSIPGLINTGIDYAAQQAQIDRILGVGNTAADRLAQLATRAGLTQTEYADLSRLAQEASAGIAGAGAAAADKLAQVAERSALSPAELQEIRNLAQQVKTESAAAGEASRVPFTPYTMTTGFGGTTVGPSGATATAAPQYEALRQQSLGLAGQTLGAINPAQAAQTLYGQIEALAAPGREREQLALQQRLQRQGLLGFGSNLPTTGGGTRAVNPLFESLLSAQETARAQQALQAQQFGTSEAARQAALAQGFLGQAQGIDQQTLAQLQATGQLGINLNQLEQANRARALQAQMQGITAPLSAGITTAQLRQADLARQAQLNQAGILAQAQSAQTAAGIPMSAGFEAARLRQADLARQAQINMAGEALRVQAAQAALGPQNQQTQAVASALQGLLNPVGQAIGTGIRELFG